MAWLTGWSYRKSHAITASVGAGTDYQMKVIVHYDGGVDSGEDVYLNSKCETDFGDIRFTDNDGSTELDYWIESKVDSDNAVIWVKVDDDLDSNQTIYIYYGKLGESTTSDGDATFLLFDDFLGVSLNLTKWFVYTGSPVVSGGLLKLTADGIDTQVGICDVGYGHAMRSRVKTTTTSVRTYFGLTYESHTGSSYHHVGFQIHPSTDIQHQTRDKDGADCSQNVTIKGRDTVFHIFDVTYLQGSSKAYIDGGFENENSCVPSPPSGKTILHPNLKEWGGIECQVDWTLVRKWIDPEPVHGAWGAEETPLKASSSSIVPIMEGIGMFQTKRESLIKPFSSRLPKFIPRVGVRG